MYLNCIISAGDKIKIKKSYIVKMIFFLRALFNIPESSSFGRTPVSSSKSGNSLTSITLAAAICFHSHFSGDDIRCTRFLSLDSFCSGTDTRGTIGRSGLRASLTMSFSPPVIAEVCLGLRS